MKIEVEKGRVREGIWGTPTEAGFNGLFCLWIQGQRVKVIASDGEGWQHVSVSLQDNPTTPPKWSLMCAVKDLFWDEEDTVVQYHPAKSEYVNCHPGCLHLWRPTIEKLPTPPSIFVGPK